MICKDCKKKFALRNTVQANKQTRCVACMIKILKDIGATL